MIPGLSRRWLVAGALSLGIALTMAVTLAVVYPRLGAWVIRAKAGAKLSARFGREVRFGTIDVAIGRAVLRGVEIRGPLDGDTPLVHVDRVEVAFDGWRALLGRVDLGPATLDGVLVTIRRDAAGRDNFHDVIERLRSSSAAGKTGSAGPQPTSISVTHGKLLANDELTGATALVADADARWTPGRIVAHARGLTATTLGAPKASAEAIEIERLAGATPVVTVTGGEISLWPKLALSGIGGKVVANPEHAGEYVIDLAGGYGGVPGRLWTARGALDPAALTASIDLEAAKFQLDRLAAILEHSAVVDYGRTAIDTELHLDVDRAGAKFSGAFHLSGLNVGHPLIADQEVRDLDLSGQIAGSFERAGRKLELTRGDFVARNVPFSITGVVTAPHAAAAELAAAGPSGTERGAGTTERSADERRVGAERSADAADRIAGADPAGPPAPPSIGPHGLQIAKLHLVIPPIDCQRVLNAIPTELAPYLEGYKVQGTFDTDIQLDIDWRDLDATQLDGNVGIRHCKVTDEPDDSPKRLEQEFEHTVEVDEDQWISFDVGPSNDEFVPLDQISPYLIKSIMTTEDSAFYQHHGFIPSEFRTALINNLKAGKFVQGASSITMQMVKNVLLYRDKTLARKLQELFLTWHVENTLTKDRILEIYLNVIEYGPGLYGIGPAAYHFFGKKPKDLSPVEAAFFSTILPSPKARYKQYCAGTLTKWTTGKIERILQLMHKRDRLTEAEYDAAIATPLQFAKDQESEDDCMKRVKLAIKNARPTNPLAQTGDRIRDPKKAKADREQADKEREERERKERERSQRGRRGKRRDERPPI